MVWNHLLNCQNNMPKSLWGKKQTNKQQYGHLVDPIVKSVWLLLLESGLGGPTSLMNSIPVSFLIWILSVCMCVCVCVCVRPMLWNTICPRSGSHVCTCAFSKQNQNDWSQGVNWINGSPLVSHKEWVTCRFYILCFLPWDGLCYTRAPEGSSDTNRPTPGRG